MPLPMQLWHIGAGHMLSAATQVAAKLGMPIFWSPGH